MFFCHAPSTIVGIKIVARVAHVIAPDIDIKTLRLRIKILLPADMPLAHGGGNITTCLERLGDGHLLEGEILFVNCLNQRQWLLDSLSSLDGNCVSDMQATGILAGKDTDPGW